MHNCDLLLKEVASGKVEILYSQQQMTKVSGDSARASMYAVRIQKNPEVVSSFRSLRALMCQKHCAKQPRNRRRDEEQAAASLSTNL
jgi:hypothetical protein